MKPRRRPRRRIESSPDVPSGGVPRLALAWYTRYGWSALKAAAADAERLDESFEQWERGARRALDELRAAGQDVVPVTVEVAALLRWCEVRARPIDAAARAEYASTLLRTTAEAAKVSGREAGTPALPGSADLAAAPLTEAELDRLEAFLAGPQTTGALTLEGMDGLFSALIAGPAIVRPGEAIRLVLDETVAFEESFASPEEAAEIVPLMLRHWNAIGATLEAGVPHVPVAFEPGIDGVVGREWARGFMVGVAEAPIGWIELLAPETGGPVEKIPLVAGQRDPDWPREPLSPEESEGLLAALEAGLLHAYRHLAPARRAAARVWHVSSPFRRADAKVGRNAPCPCGSGRKYKQCCGRPSGTVR